MANIDSILSLKVFIQSTGLTKTFRFGSEMAVGEVFKEIKTKSNITTPTGDHGLFLPPNPETGKKAVWLEKNKALRFYNIPTGSTLEFKKKHRPLRVILADGSRKMVVVDDSKNVRDISDEIGRKIGLKLVQEFSLRRLPPPPLPEGQKAEKKEGPKGDDGKEKKVEKEEKRDPSLPPKPMPWLKETKCLHEQGITQEEELEYRKKYFFADDQVEKEDAFTLHLLYVESLKAILDGRYPCTRADAKNFCAFNMQIIYGDHNPDIHTVGFLDKNQFLPAVYRKDDKKQSYEREILLTHKRLQGVKETVAKYRFVQLVRSLKFYGITFFDNCKMRVPGKKELQPFMWGVSKEKIFKFEPETEKELGSWKFEQLRKWTTDRGIFTLDFGDNADEPQMITTTDADQLSELIAGYIDIILRTRTDKDRVVENDDDDIALETEGYGEEGFAEVSFAVDFSDPYGQGAMGSAMYFPGEDYQSHGTGEDSQGVGEGSNHASLASTKKPPPTSQKINIVDMQSAIKCAKLLAQELGGKRLNQNQGRLTEAEWASQFKGHSVKIDKKVDEFLMYAKLHPGPQARNELDKQASEILQELKGLCSASGCLKDLNDDNLPLMDGTKALADTVGHILDLVMKAAETPTEDFPKTLQMCQKIWDTSKMLLAKPLLANYSDKGTHMLLASCIQDVNVNMDGLIDGILAVNPNGPIDGVLSVNKEHEGELTVRKQQEAELSVRKPNPAELSVKKPIEGDLAIKKLMKECEKARQVKGLAIDCLANLIKQILDPDVYAGVTDTAELIKQTKMSLVGKCGASGISLTQNPHLLDCSDRVDTALANLIECATTAEHRGIEGNLDIQTPIQHYLSTLAALRAQMGEDPQACAGLVRNVAKEQSSLTNLLKSLGQNQSKELVQRLQNQTEVMNGLTRDLMGEARVFIKDPSQLQAVQKGLSLIGKLETCSQELLTDAGEIAAIHNLRFNAKASTAAVLQLSAFSTNMSSFSNPMLRDQLLAGAKNVQSSLSGLLASIQGASQNPSNMDSQNDLVAATKQQMNVFEEFKSVANSLGENLTSPKEKKALETALRICDQQLKRMNKAIGQIGDVEQQSEIEQALQEFDSTKQELVTAMFFAEQGKLKAQPGQSRDGATQMLGAMAEDLEQKVEDMIADTRRGDQLADPISQLAATVAELAAQSQVTAGTIPDRTTQKKIIGATKDALDDTVSCISLARALATDTANPEKLAALQREKQKLHTTLKSMEEYASAVDTKDITTALQNVERAKASLSAKPEEGTAVPKGKKLNFKEASNTLTTSSKALLATTNQLAAVVKANPQIVGSVAKLTGSTTSQLLQLATTAATAAHSQEVSDLLLLTARALADSVKNLLTGARSTVTNRTPQTLEEFSSHHAAVKEAAENMIAALGDDTNADVSAALRNIMNNLELFEGDQIPANGSTRENILSEFVSANKELTRLAKSMTEATKMSQQVHGHYAKEAASVVEGMIGTSASANKSDGSIPSMTLDGSRIVKSSEEILAAPEDMQKLAKNVKEINLATSKLIANAREKARAEADKTLRMNIVNAIQSLMPVAQQVSISARGINPKLPQTLESFHDAIANMRDSTLELENALRASGDAEENIVESDLADQLAAATRAIALNAHELIRSTSVVASNNAEQAHDDAALQEMEEAYEQNAILLADLIKTCASLNPGVKECDRAAESLQNANYKLDAAIFAAGVDNLYRDTGMSFQDAQKETAPVLKLIGQDMQALVQAAGGSSMALKKAAEGLKDNATTLVDMVEQTAASVKDVKVQKNLLNAAKGLNVELTGLLTNVQTCNLNDKDSIERVAQASSNSQNAIGTLLGELQTGAQLGSDLDRICQTIKFAMNELANPAAAQNNYSECRESLTLSCKALARTIEHLYKVDKLSVGQIGVSAARVGEAVPTLIKDVRTCSASTKDAEAKQLLLDIANELGTTCIHLVLDVKQISLGKDCSQKFTKDYRDSNTKIASLIDAARKGAVGDLMIERAIEGINKRITMLNTAAIFAEAGQLEPNTKGPVASLSVQDLQSMVDRDVNKLSESCNNLMKVTKGGSDEDLGAAAQQLEKSLEQVANLCMALAQKVPDSITQQDILVAMKLIGFSNHQLILACKDAHKLPDNVTCKQAVAQAFAQYQDQSKAMLLTVNEIGDESVRLEKDMNKAIEAIKKLKTTVKGAEKATPEDVMEACKGILQNSAQILFAGNQKELSEAAEETVGKVQTLLQLSKPMALQAPEERVGSSFTDSIAKTIDEMVRLLQVGSKVNKADPATQTKLEGQGEVVTASINGIVAALRRFTNLASAQQITLDDDLDSLAEAELLKCAQIIEEAMSSLAQFSADKTEKKGPKDVLNLTDINAAIFDAATAMAKATSQLVHASVQAQKDRTKEGRAKSGAKYHADPMWANGLISASQGVAASVKELVNAANVISDKGKGDEATLIAAARGVAASTAHLVAASRTKADPNAQSQRQLQVAAKSVAQATAKLVDSAQSIGIYDEANAEQAEIVVTDVGAAVGGVRMEMEQNIKIMNIMKQLEQERMRRANFRTDKYKATRK